MVRRHSRALTAAVAVGLVLLLGTAAWAFWTAAGAGAGAAATGTLNSPTGASATSMPGSGSAGVNWTAPSDGAGPSGYFVKRSPAGGGAAAFACGTSDTTLVTGTSCTDSAVDAGSYTYVVTAVLGSWTAESAPSSPVTVTTIIGTTTAVVSSANPSVAGQQVTYTATVAPLSGASTPTGTVTFRDVGSAITCTGGNQVLASGTATCQLAYATPGSHTITAVYDGSASHSGSTSPSLVQTVVKADTTTALSASANPSRTGQSVVYTATVLVASPGGGTPTGSFVFRDGATAIAGCAAVPVSPTGQASCTTSYPAASSPRSVTATYGGDTSFNGSTSNIVTQSIDRASTTTFLTSGTNPSVTGQSVTLTATVAVVAPGAGSPTGSVAFKDGSSTISCTGGNQVLSAGIATCVTRFSASGGSRSLTAVYAGDSNFESSTTTAALTQTVNKASTGVSLSSDRSPAKTGQTVTYTAVVAPSAPGAGQPTGSVTFRDAGSAISCTGGTQTVNTSGVATCQATYAALSSHPITAVYNGDTDFSTSTSTSHTQRVVSASVAGIAFTNVTVNASAASCPVGGSASYTCTVSGGNNALASAKVLFVDGAGVGTVYSIDASTMAAVAGGKNPGTSQLTVNGGTFTSTTNASVTKNGSNTASVTVTFTDGGTTYAATLTIT